jgi:DNA-directed RNA polymerase subunit RPC12/RpoP
MKYRCANCNYRFSPKTDKVPNRCPYCSSPGIMMEETASSLLRSSGKRQIPQ